MKYLSKISEFNSSKADVNRVLLVTGVDDYHASSFEREYGGTPVKDILDNLSDYESDDWELKVYEFGSIDPEFVQFIKDNIQDYDHSKTTNFYLEGTVIE